MAADTSGGPRGSKEDPIVPMNCPHRATPLTLPYGGRVIGSGCFERTPDDVVPNFGLYAYDGWRPTWPAAFIDWPDFGLPVDTDEATSLIVDAFARVRNGELVEVGCHAGNGRTGSIIACMVILAGIASTDAVEWTREHYCWHAIDTKEQERWVGAFAPDRR